MSTVPVTTTIVTYERGELDIRLQQSNHSESIRVPMLSAKESQARSLVRTAENN